MRSAAALLAAVVLSTSLTACGDDAGHEQEKQAEEGFAQAADLSTCSADAKPAAEPYGDGFPADWPFPPKTVVFNAEDRGADGATHSIWT